MSRAMLQSRSASQGKVLRQACVAERPAGISGSDSWICGSSCTIRGPRQKSLLPKRSSNPASHGVFRRPSPGLNRTTTSPSRCRFRPRLPSPLRPSAPELEPSGPYALTVIRDSGGMTWSYIVDRPLKQTRRRVREARATPAEGAPGPQCGRPAFFASLGEPVAGHRRRTSCDTGSREARAPRRIADFEERL